ncbi:MAG: alanine--tRNA ligase [Candidatus Gracilibacteria bacterium]|nr:alanine--tRNA ligase [Candidatus Gracilibacteria bacterium]
MRYTSTEIRQKFLDFFKNKNHEIIPSAPVVPENDPTVLFNTAGMQPLVPYLLGEKHPSGTRLADSQKCIRTGDIEEVGDNSHLTFFEMLGNWSLGDYFKKESINYSYEFLTSLDWLALDPKKIAVTVFEGDKDAPRDEESAQIWEDVGMPKNKISYLNASENWWAAGDTGPCGPDSEIFYWVGESEFPPEESNVGNDEDNWMEIWNNVFMEYKRVEDGTLEKLPNQNVDTGMGLERIVATLNGEKTVYNTDIFDYIINKITEVIGTEYNEKTLKAIRIIADHSRTATVMISDGVVPSNVDQGYVLRRLMRISIRQAHKLGFKGLFLSEVAEVIIEKLGLAYPHMIDKKSTILEEIVREEKQFVETLEKGLKEFEKLTSPQPSPLRGEGARTGISGKEAFKLYDTFGFPLEMTIDLAEEKGLKVDVEGFKEAEKKHQELSRAGAEQKFKGGLADDGEETTALHSATHLLLAGLNDVLGGGISQKGSNITAERLRFDFNFDRKVTREELDKVEDFVNKAITSECEVVLVNMDKQEAKDSGVEGSFWEKYPEVVKVYTFKSNSGEVFSKELCGGPHVENTKTMGTFKIKKEESSSRGVRRIKAVLIK